MNESENRQVLLNIRQAAEMLSVSVSTLYGWIWQKRIPFVKIGRSVRFDIRDLEQFIRSNRFTVYQR